MACQVSVLIPTALRPQVDNQSSLTLSGDSVGEVLAALKSRSPQLGARLYRSDTELNRFINVYLNDEDIRFLGHLDTPVKDGDELALVPAIAGG